MTKLRTKKFAVTAAKVRLNDVAMLVDLTVHFWSPVTTDDSVGDEIAKTHKAQRRMGQFNKDLIDHKAEPFQALVSLRNALRKQHAFYTLPWVDGGIRILASKGYFKYMTEIEKLVEQYSAAAVRFVAAYAKLKADAKALLGTMYQEKDYYDIKDLQSRYSVTLRFFPVPDREDFRVDLGTEETARIKAGIQETVTGQFNDAIKTIWERLSKVVEKMATTLKAYKRLEPESASTSKAKVVKGEKKKRTKRVESSFKDTLVTNITELLDVVPLLNIKDDPTINTFVARMRDELTAVAPEVLRDDSVVRAQVVTAAEDILKKMSGYLA